MSVSDEPPPEQKKERKPQAPFLVMESVEMSDEPAYSLGRAILRCAITMGADTVGISKLLKLWTGIEITEYQIRHTFKRKELQWARASGRTLWVQTEDRKRYTGALIADAPEDAALAKSIVLPFMELEAPSRLMFRDPRSLCVLIAAVRKRLSDPYNAYSIHVVAEAIARVFQNASAEKKLLEACKVLLPVSGGEYTGGAHASAAFRDASEILITDLRRELSEGDESRFGTYASHILDQAAAINFRNTFVKNPWQGDAEVAAEVLRLLQGHASAAEMKKTMDATFNIRGFHFNRHTFGDMKGRFSENQNRVTWQLTTPLLSFDVSAPVIDPKAERASEAMENAAKKIQMSPLSELLCPLFSRVPLAALILAEMLEDSSVSGERAWRILYTTYPFGFVSKDHFLTLLEPTEQRIKVVSALRELGGWSAAEKGEVKNFVRGRAKDLLARPH